MYNDISEILIKAARSASQATVLELIKQANNKRHMIKSAGKASVFARLGRALGLKGMFVAGLGAPTLYEGGQFLYSAGKNSGYERGKEDAAKAQKEENARKSALDAARQEGHKAGRAELSSELETQRRAAAEREAMVAAAEQAGIANASGMTIDQLANFFAQHPELQIPDSIRDLVNSRNQSDLSTMLSNNKFMLGGGLAGAGIGYGLAGEDTKSKVLGTLLGGSLGGGLGALVDNYVK